MSNNLRFRHGDTNPVFIAPASATVIEIGDLCFLDPESGKPEPASSLIDQGSEGLNQDAFQQYFLGVAMDASATGQTAAVGFATRGNFEFTCSSDTFILGETIGATEASSGTALEDQAVATVTGASKAIARVNKPEAVAVTKVEVRIVSTIMDGGIQDQTAGSSSGPV